MARLCIITCVLVFGVALVPVVLTHAAERSSDDKKSDATACDILKKCAAACKTASAEVGLTDKDGPCAAACDACRHACELTACLVKTRHAGCDDAKKLCATLLADCVKECNKSDAACCKACAACCEECLTCCKGEKAAS